MIEAVRKPGHQQWDSELMPGQFRHLFDHLPGTMFFAKDAEFRLVMGNPAFVRRCGLEREADLVGLTDEEIFSPALAEKYRRDDERVLSTGEPLFGLVELFPNESGSPEWYVTDKLPLLDRRGRTCGLCGTVRSYEGQHEAIRPYLELAPAVERLKAGYRDPLDIDRLARMSNLSARQFGRKFHATFRMSPRAYLMQIRVIRACELLAETELPITEIALESGFYDHSDLARHFGKRMGMTATEYRRNARSEREQE